MLGMDIMKICWAHNQEKQSNTHCSRSHGTLSSDMETKEEMTKTTEICPSSLLFTLHGISRNQGAIALVNVPESYTGLDEDSCL